MQRRGSTTARSGRSLLAVVLLAFFSGRTAAESGPLEELDVVEEVGLSPTVALQIPHVVYEIHTGQSPLYHLDAPDKVFQVRAEQTSRFMAAVKKNDGFTFVATIQPAESSSKVVLLSVDESRSNRSAFLRLCYDTRMQALLLEYNNVTTRFHGVQLSTREMNKIVLVVRHLNVRLYVNCRLTGTAKLREHVDEMRFLQWAEFRLGSTGASIANQFPYKGAIQEMKFLFKDVSPEVLGSDCSPEEKSEYLKGLFSMYGCSHGCPLVAQLVDTFQAMSIEIDNLKLLPCIPPDEPTDPGQDTCIDEKTGFSYHHSETWAPRANPCRNCSCHRGNITCLDTACPHINCRIPYQLPDQCCPSCLPPQSRMIDHEPSTGPSPPPPPRPPVAVTWSNWGPWGMCSESCGGGLKERMRSCNKITGQPGYHDCEGGMLEEDQCNTNPCPIDGGWSEWAEWSSCSTTCEEGIQTRKRECNNPAPKHGGSTCKGEDNESKSCVLRKYCPIDGGWSEWTEWSSCSTTCEEGIQIRKRECNNPAPEHGGSTCKGEDDETKSCVLQKYCPIDGGWSEWTEWSSCSTTCEEGIQRRKRACNNPAPEHGGFTCLGENNETTGCVLRKECPSLCIPNPCFNEFVQCTHVNRSHFSCGSCPVGSEGDGIKICRDINECKRVPTACHPLTKCKNKKSGYMCTSCPSGYSGPRIRGRGLEDARTKKQHCIDIDECSQDNGGCRHSPCINTVGSYQCGDCDPGYSREGQVDNQCILVNVCPLGWHNCTGNFKCQPAGNLSFVCICPEIGHFFKNGMCVKDTDFDGYPDKEVVGCSEKWCKRDNCPHVPNRGQEDYDHDGIGDACDPDDDGDGITDERDNCQFLSNKGQADTDRDGVGNLCDNCLTTWNPYQENFDHDEDGDACDTDPDSDNIPNGVDNCPLARNDQQVDTDSDLWGDSCDNCPFIPNPDQSDEDYDLVGDKCDDNVDRDNDGIQDSLDICSSVPNGDQANHDLDGDGDVCDKDDDDDGWVDALDNCPLVKNPKQEDVNENGIGDVCENDYDGDSFTNDIDICPRNREIDRADFVVFHQVPLYHKRKPVWRVHPNGLEIVQEKLSSSGIAVGHHRFSNVDFNGTFFVNAPDHGGYFGIVFSYQSNRRFYVAMWKREKKVVRSGKAIALPGLHIKLVNSLSGPGSALERALWHTGSTPGQTRLLWHDKKQIPWQSKTPYRWMLSHNAERGMMRLRIYEGGELIIDTETVFDLTLRGGQLGFFVLRQPQMIWSDLSYRCQD